MNNEDLLIQKLRKPSFHEIQEMYRRWYYKDKEDGKTPSLAQVANFFPMYGWELLEYVTEYHKERKRHE